MAGGGYADVPALHIAGSAADDGDDRPAVDADPRLVHHGIGRLQRLHLHHNLDRRVPHNKSAGAEIQARLMRRRCAVAAGVRRCAANFPLWWLL